MTNSIKSIKLFSLIIALSFLLNGCNSSKSNFQANVSNNNSKTSTSATENNDKINSGLLLGLAEGPDLQNNTINNTDFENKTLEKYRSLWIYGNGSNIAYSEIKDGIIAPYGNNFIKLKTESLVVPTLSDQSSDNFYSKYSSYYNFSVVLSQSTSENKKLLTKDTLDKLYLNSQEGDMGGSYISRTETIQYAGNKYAAVKISVYATGGGTYRSSFDDIKLYDIKDLSDLGAKRASINLKNLLGSDVNTKLKTLSESYNKSETSAANSLVKVKDSIDDTNLTLKREAGKWTVQAPLYELYTHEGNGSNFNIIKNLYDANINVPDSITSYDTLCVDWNTIKNKIPDAKDAVSSPNKDMLVVLTNTDLKVFIHPEKGLDKPIKTLAVDKNERIVLNQWATGNYVSKWTKALSN